MVESNSQFKSDVMKDWCYCPECQECTVDIVSDNCSEDFDEAYYMAKCSKCGWHGEVWFNMEYCDTITRFDNE